MQSDESNRAISEDYKNFLDINYLILFNNIN